MDNFRVYYSKFSERKNTPFIGQDDVDVDEISDFVSDKLIEIVESELSEAQKKCKEIKH